MYTGVLNLESHTLIVSASREPFSLKTALSYMEKLAKKQSGGVYFWLYIQHIECRFNNNSLLWVFFSLVVHESTCEEEEHIEDDVEEGESPSQSHFVTPKNRWTDSKWKNTKSVTPYPGKLSLFCFCFVFFRLFFPLIISWEFSFLSIRLRAHHFTYFCRSCRPSRPENDFPFSIN